MQDRGADSHARDLGESEMNEDHRRILDDEGALGPERSQDEQGKRECPNKPEAQEDPGSPEHVRKQDPCHIPGGRVHERTPAAKSFPAVRATKISSRLIGSTFRISA